ncbi:MAG TPA: metallophosphoesterase [Solirubrobacteraceae bacterium]|nr:metallophosphoesterase [Solirubrobacteraceae bacterium]
MSCALDAAIVLGAVASRRVWALGAAVALLAVKGLAMRAAGLDTFGVAHVLWLDLVIVLPLAGAAAFAVTRRPVALVALLAVPLGVYASLVEPSRLVTERATVAIPGAPSLRLGVIADLQFEHVGEHERDAVARLMRERPDVVLVAGDLHQGSAETFERELPAIRALLRGLRAPGGVYAVQGDVESAAELRRAVEGTAVRPLVNEVVRTRGLAIGGVERTFATRAARAAVSELEREPGVRILLAHRPDVALRRPRVDLVVAGHTHGGQVQVPFLGPPFTASEISRDIAAGGLHTLDGLRIYVTRGVGVERGQAPRLRFRAVPEVSVVTLR